MDFSRMGFSRMDVFPSVFSQRIRPLRHPMTRNGFRDLIATTNIQPINSYMEHGKLYYEKISREGRILEHFIRVGIESFSRALDGFMLRDAHWIEIEKTLIDKRDNLRNAPVTMFFKYGNVFLVKKNFTFGHRRVDPGTFHIFQTTRAPLLLYELRREWVGSSVSLVNRSLRGLDQHCYTKYVLEPESRYRIPPDTRYVLVARRAALFSVDVVDDPMEHLAFRDYHEERAEYEHPSFDIPPMTPPMDMLEMMAAERYGPPTPDADGTPYESVPTSPFLDIP